MYFKLIIILQTFTNKTLFTFYQPANLFKWLLIDSRIVAEVSDVEIVSQIIDVHIGELIAK